MAKTKIDVDHEGTLSMEFDRESVKFNTFDVMKALTHETHNLYQIDFFDSLEQEVIWDVYETMMVMISGMLYLGIRLLLSLY